MDITLEIKTKIGELWLPDIYRKKIRTLRTRSYNLPIPERENTTTIQHTLLGVELKVGKIRLACPDLSTAQYLQVFARLGCREIAIPYDISRIPDLAGQLETAWNQTLFHFAELTVGKTPPIIGKFRAGLIKNIRLELGEVGAGELMPQFNQTTKQRAK